MRVGCPRFDLNNPSLSISSSTSVLTMGLPEEAENALVAYQALTNGVSRCVTYRAARGLDSHSGDDWATSRSQIAERVQSVAALATLLEDTLILRWVLPQQNDDLVYE